MTKRPSLIDLQEALSAAGSAGGWATRWIFGWRWYSGPWAPDWGCIFIAAI